MYRVVFDDGSFVEADGDHLWKVRGRHERRNHEGWVTITTRELLERGVKRPNGIGVARQWEIPIQGPAEFPNSQRPSIRT
jgi:hypothetical protein